MTATKTATAGAMLGLSMLAASPIAAVGAEPPAIGEIAGLEIESYCTFMASGHEFVYADQGTWRFVFLTSLFENDLAYMHIDGEQRELHLTDMRETSDAEIRTYQGDEDTPYVVNVLMLSGESGFEHTNYTGSVLVSRDGVASATAFQGDCGV